MSELASPRSPLPGGGAHDDADADVAVFDHADADDEVFDEADADAADDEGEDPLGDEAAVSAEARTCALPRVCAVFVRACVCVCVFGPMV